MTTLLHIVGLALLLAVCIVVVAALVMVGLRIGANLPLCWPWSVARFRQSEEHELIKFRVVSHGCWGYFDDGGEPRMATLLELHCVVALPQNGTRNGRSRRFSDEQLSRCASWMTIVGTPLAIVVAIVGVALAIMIG